ncbi:MAG TPA: sensor histidine kinase [Niastella sp.]
MQIFTKELISLIVVASAIFLIAPVSLIAFVMLYNSRKKRHEQEKEWLKTNFENELLKSQMEVHEQTMQNVAANLHDNIGQLMSLLIVTLSSIKPDQPQRVHEKVDSASEIAKRAIKELRQLSRVMHGQELIRMGLAEAIAFELDYLQTAGLHTIRFNNNYQSKAGQTDKEIILFRIFQEVLNNSVRHGEATAIDVSIDQDDRCLKLTIKDNGKGFDEKDLPKEKKGMGLFNIKKRVALIAGEVDIITSPGNGTEIKIVTPYP